MKKGYQKDKTLARGKDVYLGVKWLKEATFEHEVLKAPFESLIDLYEYLTLQVKKISKEVVTLSRSNKYSHKMKLMRSVPGIGILKGMELLVELADMDR